MVANHQGRECESGLSIAVVPALSSDAQLRIGGPIRRSLSIETPALDTFRKITAAAWVPAFAGTSASVRTL